MMEAWQAYKEEEQELARKNALGLNTGSTYRSGQQRQVPSVLLKDTPYGKATSYRRDPLDSYLDTNKTCATIRNK